MWSPHTWDHMDPRFRKHDQALSFDGRQMPRGLQEQRLCDLSGCARPSASLVAAPDGSVLLVCDTCAEDITGPRPTPKPQAVRPSPADEVPDVPVPEKGHRVGARTSWATWVRAAAGVALAGWGVALLVSQGDAFDAVATTSVGIYLLLDLVRPRFRT